MKTAILLHRRRKIELECLPDFETESLGVIQIREDKRK